MTATKTTVTTINLELTQHEAEWLLNYLQNYLGPEPEPLDSLTMRPKLFTVLDSVLP